MTSLDRDEGKNGEIEFTMVNSYGDKFTIDKADGMVRLNKPLSEDDVGKTFLTVKASDLGTVNSEIFVAVFIYAIFVIRVTQN